MRVKRVSSCWKSVIKHAHSAKPGLMTLGRVTPLPFACFGPLALLWCPLILMHSPGLLHWFRWPQTRQVDRRAVLLTQKYTFTVHRQLCENPSVIATGSQGAPLIAVWPAGEFAERHHSTYQRRGKHIAAARLETGGDLLAMRLSGVRFQLLMWMDGWMDASSWMSWWWCVRPNIMAKSWDHSTGLLFSLITLVLQA